MKSKFSLVEFSVDHPKWVLAGILVLTAAASSQFPKVTIDTNPKHMLPATSDVRVWNDQVDRAFALYEDVIVLGIQNNRGILNRDTLEKIHRISGEILKIKGVAARDVTGFTTIDHVTVGPDTLRVAPLMSKPPESDAEIGELGKALRDNPLFMNRIISPDEKTTAIYLPLEKGANGKEIADEIRALVRKERGDERYHVAGDPVARDTFGAEMFKLMAIFAPLAGLVMFAVRYFMFRDLFLSIALMMDAMIAIVWSMGLLIGLGFPIHIMSSMAPVFLMAIATDSIHIFNEFYFRYRERKDRRLAILETMHAVGRPVRYTALATAAGFAVLLFMNIVPVRVFGGLVAFGTIALRLLSFSFIPAMFALSGEKNLERASREEETGRGWTALTLQRIASFGGRRPWAVAAAGVALVAASVWGMTRITINNNMVHWFKPGSEVRMADRVLNETLGGTSLAYVVADAGREEFVKTPEAMRTIEDLQRHLEKLRAVGKTFSVADYVKRINRVLHDDDPTYDRVPDSEEAIAQSLLLFSMSAKPSDLDNVVDPAYRRANIWVQLKTWDAQAIREVIRAVDEFKSARETPLSFGAAGPAYFNLVWNNEVLWDMVKGFVGSLIVVFVVLVFTFRSVRWAAVGYMPLLFTVVLIYGVVGFAGKDFDMPISVLSCLSLGMAVDFAIHFISRFRRKLAEDAPVGTIDRRRTLEALEWAAARPGKGIVRNAFLFASSFSVMLFASLTPYVTVGAFIVSMMILSALMTILCLPALVVLFRKYLLATPGRAQDSS